MAAFNHFKDLYDVALKPRLLRSIVKEHLHDESQTFRNLNELSSIVSTLKSHKLLSETTPPDSTIEKHVSNWKSSVDTFIDRILTLTRNDLPDKCWIGICLVGVTCTECSSDRFLASYSDWFNLLLQHIQPFGVSPFVKVASCAAVSDLITRLGGFSNVKKDGNSLASKLVQPILKTLNEDGNEALLEAATQLLSTILIYFPSSVLRHHENVEGAIVSKVMSGSCNVSLSKKLAYCLALLPQSRGDEESWSLMMQKILLSLSGLLKYAFEGVEEESVRDEAVALLIPPGKDCPPSLGGHMMPGEAWKGERSHLISSISSLMHACCTLVTTSYPVQVTVPVRPLLAVIRRVLIVNGSLPESVRPFTTVMEQELVCSQLPVLHLNALEVLAATVKGIRSQLLPYSADVVHTLMGYFKRCWLPELRTKVYSIIRVLLISMGAGMSLHIFHEVINNGYIDLTFDDSGNNGELTIEESVVEATLQRRAKKRKHGNAGGLMEQHASFGSELKTAEECSTLITLKVAAVEALEALLVVGGALKSDGWRRKLDNLLVQVAMNTCRGAWSDNGKPCYPKEPKSTWEDFQLVALRALLASLLSPADVRPPHLAQGLELFRKGKQGTGSKVAEFCAQALLSLEVLVHPRTLSLMDMSSQYGNNYYSGRTVVGGIKYKPSDTNAKFKTTSYGNPHDVDDFLNDVYLENGSGSEVPSAEGSKSVHFEKNSAEISRGQDLEEPKIVNYQSDEMITDKDVGPANHIVQTEANGDRIMLDLKHHKESGEMSQEPEKNELDIDASTAVNHALTSEPDQASKGNAVSSSKLKLSVFAIDDELSDSFPDIIDGDPDTDIDSDY